MKYLLDLGASLTRYYPYCIARLNEKCFFYNNNNNNTTPNVKTNACQCLNCPKIYIYINLVLYKSILNIIVRNDKLSWRIQGGRGDSLNFLKISLIIHPIFWKFWVVLSNGLLRVFSYAKFITFCAYTYKYKF